LFKSNSNTLNVVWVVPFFAMLTRLHLQQKLPLCFIV